MDKKRALKILEEIERRKPVDLLSTSFPKQTDFINDPSEMKAALTTRRAGKSYAVAIMLVKFCLENQNTRCAYLSLTRDHCQRVMTNYSTGALRKLLRDFKIKAHFTKIPLSLSFSNGSSIHFQGINDTEEEREKLRGEHFKLVVVDECGSMTIDFQKALDDVISPTLWDDKGQLVLIGTPSNQKNYFWNITTNQVPGWSNHFWTADDNPYTREGYHKDIDKKKLANPNIYENHGFQQEFLGQWTVDATKQLYKYSPLNLIAPIDTKLLYKYTFILAMDIGWEDDNSFVVGAWSQHDDKLYILYSWSKNHMYMEEIIAKVEEIKKQFPISIYVIDSSNKMYVEDLKRKSRIPFLPATKGRKGMEKINYIHMLNSDFAINKIQIVKDNCQSLLKEYDKLIRVKDDTLNYEAAVGAQADHNADAALYLWTYSYHYNATPEIPEAPIHSEERIEKWWKEQEEQMEHEKNKAFWDL